MRKTVQIVLMTTLCLFATQSQAQIEPCGTDRIMQYYRSLDSNQFDAEMLRHTTRINNFRTTPLSQYFSQVSGGYQTSSLGSGKPRFIIPVMVHVFHASADNTAGTGTNISSAQIDNQIAVLNAAFDTIGIRFCLAGITRHSDSGINQHIDSQLQVTALTNVVYNAPSSYLNIYVVRSILENNNSESDLQGYNNSFPGVNRIDAVVVRYQRFGDSTTCSGCNLDYGSLGKTAVHEIGHYLGLWHTFQGTCLGGSDAATCSTRGDRCCDTPPHDQPASEGCASSPNTCNETYGGNAADPIHNYMNYTGEACINHFTPDQVAIMYATLYGPRRSLIDPVNINGQSLSCSFKSSFFLPDKTLLCDKDTIHFTAYAQSGAQYKWQVYSDSTTYNGTFSSSNIFNYYVSKQTSYTITLTVISGTDTIILTDSNLVQYANCGQPIASTQGNWYFGKWAELNFKTVQPVFNLGPYFNRIPYNINTDEGTISQSNAMGQLLFYGGGEADANYRAGTFRIYKDNYNEMPNSPVIGDYSATQGGLVLPHWSDGSKFYLVTVSGTVADGTGFTGSTSADDKRGMRYSIIDTAQNDVDVNNKDIPVRISLSGHEYSARDTALITGEMITAIPKCNGTDYWILVSGGLSSGYHKDRLLVLSYDSSGINYHSHVDSIFGNSSVGVGFLKFSPNGLFIAGSKFIADFDRSAGIISNVRSKTMESGFGMSFSPNSRILYQTEGTTIYQYNLLSQNPTTTKIAIGILPNQGEYTYQLGPDNKIYISLLGQTNLAVINYPDLRCSVRYPNRCGFNLQGPALSKNGIGGECQSGLPNMVDAKTIDKVTPEIFAIDSACSKVRFYSTISCDNAYLWDFGDGDNSTEKNPVHTYATEGSYNVILYTIDTTLYKTVNIGLESPIVSGDTLTSCDTSRVYIYSCGNDNDFYSYSWNITNGNIIYVDENTNTAYVKWQQNGVLRLTAQDESTGCSSKDSISLIVMPEIYNIIDTPSIGACNGAAPALVTSQPTFGGYGIGTYTYKWYKSTDTGTVKNWTLVSGATDSVYQPPAQTQTTWHYRQVTSGSCELASNIVKVQMRVANNAISLDTTDCDDVLGSIPSSNIGIQSYAWERSANSITWETISGETQKDLKYPVFFDTTYVRRIVTDSNTCSSTSNVVIPAIFTGDITYSGDTLCTGSELNVSGNAPCSGHKTISYDWMYRKLGTSTYSYLSGYSQNYTHSSWTDSCYIKREMISYGKVAYSDSVLIPLRPLLINYLLEDGDTTCRARNLHPIYGSFSCASPKYFFRWQTTLDTNATWTDAGGSGIAYDYNPPSASQTTYYRRRMIYDVNGSRDTTYSNTYTIYVMNPEITLQPQNTTVNDGASANFSISLNEMTLLRWEKRTGSSPSYTWVTVDFGSNPYSFVTDLCMNGGVYRAVVFNPCTNDEEYSSEAVLTVNSLNYDLWAKDNESDIFASEPSTGFIWNSPDIWNRKNNDTSSVHENPEYRYTAPNYLRAIVRNTNNATSVPAKLFVYWTFASTGERWDRNWLSNTSNNDSASGNWKTYYGARKELGGLIGEYNIPALAPGEVYKVSTSWIVPDPGIVVGDSNASNQADVCFLSRIVTCTNPNYGMFVPETTLVGKNVRDNNNIVTKNFVVYDALPGNGRVSWGGNGNPNDGASATGVLRLRAGNCDFFRYGYVILHLDPTLQNIWTNTDGSGYTVVDDSTLMVDTCVEVVMENIAYEAGQYGLLGVEFVMRNDYTTLSTFDAFYEFDLEEMLNEDTVSIGGIHYGVPMHIEPLPESGMQRRIPSDNKQAIVGKTSFHAYPNPFTDQLTINYHIPKEEQVNIVITNLLGQKVAIIENNTFKQSGIHKFTFNSAALKEGIYFINFTAGSYTQTQKVVLIR